MMIRDLFHIKIVYKIVKNQHIFNGRTDFLVTILELLRLLHSTSLYEESEKINILKWN